MGKLTSRGVVMVAGLLAGPAMTEPGSNSNQPPDNRHVLLDRFFAARSEPARAHVGEFLKAADRNDLDWRLLPSLAHVESGGGKFCKNNNLFGWRSSKGSFPSIRAAIHTVADRLGTSKLYRDKTLREILRTYNQRVEFTSRVLRVMQTIGPAEPHALLN